MMNAPTRRRTLYAVLISMIVAAATTALSPAQAAAQFTPTACPEAFAELPLTLDCGLVTVPLEHDAPQRGTIALAVFRARAASDNPAPDPLVMVQGGPGGSVDSLVFAAAFGLQDILAERDLVFVEQRGNRYSRPSLVCPTYFDKVAASLTEPTQLDMSGQLLAEAVEGCLSAFAAEGIDLAAFDSYENARDLPTVVIDALGYPSYNLYGVSYGSLLAQHVMEAAPRGLRSVILDAVVPRDLDYNQQSIAHGWRAFARLAEACAADETCASANPDLEARLLALIERLTADPVDAPLASPVSGETFIIKLDGSRLAAAVYNALYDTNGLVMLPSQITAAAERGDFAWAAQMLAALLEPGFSVGMNWAINCSERGDDAAASQPIIGPDVPQVFAQAMQDAKVDDALLCSLVQVPRIPAEANTPADVDIPTLLMSGEYDPITPPEYGQRVAASLPSSVHIAFPGIGHGAFSSACPASIMAAFLNDPTAEIDLSCVESMGLRFRLTLDLTERTVGTAAFPVPADWVEVEPGVFTDMGARALIVQEAEGRVLPQVLDQLLGEGVMALGEDTVSQGQQALGAYTWTIYTLRLDSEGIVLFAAGTETEARTYIILLQGEVTAAQELQESLLIPVLAAFRGD